MPTYCFKCPECGRTDEAVMSMTEAMTATNSCGHCGIDMNRDYPAEHAGVRGDYNKPIISESMAFDSIDLAEHRKRFPDVEVEVDGRVAKPILRNLGQRRRYLKGRGFVDQNAFN